MTLEQWLTLREAFEAIPDNDKNNALHALALKFFRQEEKIAEGIEPEWARDIDESDGVQ